MKTVKKKIKFIASLKDFMSTVLYCIKLSWNTSRYYTLVRLIGRILTPVFGIITTYLLKYILDFLSVLGHQ